MFHGAIPILFENCSLYVQMYNPINEVFSRIDLKKIIVSSSSLVMFFLNIELINNEFKN